MDGWKGEWMEVWMDREVNRLDKPRKQYKLHCDISF